jgi:hypothetical protein
VYAKTIEQEHPERAEQARELADLFCRQARRRADVLFEQLWHNDDDLNTKRAFGVLDGRYTWVEDGVIDPSGEGPMIQEQPEGVETKRGDEVASGGPGNSNGNGNARQASTSGKKGPANPNGKADEDIRATA